jgi:hypothetical protein
MNVKDMDCFDSSTYMQYVMGLHRGHGQSASPSVLVTGREAVGVSVESHVEESQRRAAHLDLARPQPSGPRAGGPDEGEDAGAVVALVLSLRG